MKKHRTIAALFIAAAALSSAAQAEQLRIVTGIGTPDASRPALAFSPCESPDEWGECVTAEVGCTVQGGFISITDGAEIAERLVKGSYGESNAVTITTAAGAVVLPVYNVSLGANDLEGNWTATLEISDMQTVFRALADNPAQPFTVSVAGQNIDLTARAADRRYLQQLGELCDDPAKFTASLDLMS